MCRCCRPTCPRSTKNQGENRPGRGLPPCGVVHRHPHFLPLPSPFITSEVERPTTLHLACRSERVIQEDSCVIGRHLHIDPHAHFSGKVRVLPCEPEVLLFFLFFSFSPSAQKKRAAMIWAPGACRSSPKARRSNSKSLMLSQCGTAGPWSGSGRMGMGAPCMRRRRSPQDPTPGVCISMASSGISALGWCRCAGPPWTLGRFWPHSRFCLLASPSPCSRTISLRSTLGGALPASRCSHRRRLPNALDLLRGCLLGLHRRGQDRVLNTRPPL